MVADTKLYTICSLLMASLFAVSASVQFNDTDWYFWLPLYACASFVHLLSCWAVSSKRLIKHMAKLALWLGILLFIKVLVEDYAGGISGFWSIDMRERVVREKLGSGLVFVSMILQLAASSIRNDPREMKNKRSRIQTNLRKSKSTGNSPLKTKRTRLPTWVKYGMAILVGISYGLSIFFLSYHAKGMKF
ncbi:hypothetical protein Ancab_026102 [Ancistrocladus abbreviatus]